MSKPKWDRFDRLKGVDDNHWLTQAYDVCEAVVNRKQHRGSWSYKPADIFKTKREIRKSLEAFRAAGIRLREETVFIKEVRLFDMEEKWDNYWWEVSLDKEVAWAIVNKKKFPDFVVRDLGKLAKDCHKRGISAFPKLSDLPNRDYDPFKLTRREKEAEENENWIDENIKKFLSDMRKPEFLHMYYDKYPELRLKIILVDRFSHPRVTLCRLLKIIRRNELSVIRRIIRGEDADISLLDESFYKFVNLKKPLTIIDPTRYRHKILDIPRMFECGICHKESPNLGYTVCEVCREQKLRELYTTGDKE